MDTFVSWQRYLLNRLGAAVATNWRCVLFCYGSLWNRLLQLKMLWKTSKYFVKIIYLWNIIFRIVCRISFNLNGFLHMFVPWPFLSLFSFLFDIFDRLKCNQFESKINKLLTSETVKKRMVPDRSYNCKKNWHRTKRLIWNNKVLTIRIFALEPTVALVPFWTFLSVCTVNGSFPITWEWLRPLAEDALFFSLVRFLLCCCN